MSHGDSLKKYVSLGLLLLSAQLVGCGGAPAGPVEKLVPVAGNLKVDGKPAEGITILFSPADNSPTRGGYAKTDAQGNFKVEHNVLLKPGIPAGKYTLTYSKFAKPDGSPVPPGVMPANVGAIQTIPPAWNDATKAGQHNQVTIPAEGAPALELNVDTKLRVMSR